jgi:hypothetical protein
MRCGEEYSKNPVAKLSAVCTMKPRVQLWTVDVLLHCSSWRPRFGIICDSDARLGPRKHVNLRYSLHPKKCHDSPSSKVITSFSNILPNSAFSHYPITRRSIVWATHNLSEKTTNKEVLRHLNVNFWLSHRIPSLNTNLWHPSTGCIIITSYIESDF